MLLLPVLMSVATEILNEHISLKTMLLEFLIGLLGFVLLYFIKLRSYQSYWTSKGIWQLKLSIKEAWDLITVNKNINLLIASTYDKAKKFGHEKLYGIAFGNATMVVVGDPDLLKQIMVKDFDSFVDRDPDVVNEYRLNSNVNSDRIWGNTLLNLQGERWKQVRYTFTPIFTTGRMKAMSVLMKHSVHQLVNALNQAVPGSGKSEIEVKDFIGRYSMDVVARCAFGVESQSFDTTRENQLVKNAASFFTKKPWEPYINVLFQVPIIGAWIVKMLNLPTVSGDEINFFYDVINQTLKERIRSKSKKNDIIDMMIEALRGDLKEDKEQNDDEYDKDAKLNSGSKLKGMSAEEENIIMVATAMILLIAGYDTTAVTLTNACYELAKNLHVQERLREEVDEAYNRQEDEDCVSLEYKDIQFMDYLDQVLNEILRKHPLFGTYTRAAAKDYNISGGRGTIPKQSLFMLTVLSLHMSPDYFPEPDKFDPNRFSKEGKAKRHTFAYLPFGHGPRSCIGMRFAQHEAKLALAALVRHFEITPCSRTVEKIEIDDTSNLMAPNEAIYVSLRKRF